MLPLMTSSKPRPIQDSSLSANLKPPILRLAKAHGRFLIVPADFQQQFDDQDSRISCWSHCVRVRKKEHSRDPQISPRETKVGEYVSQQRRQQTTFQEGAL